ncbi:acyl-CoA dehydrogenase family protein [Streptomyces sparsus]
MTADTAVKPLAAAARKVVPLATRHAADADTGRELHPDVVDALLDAGFARHFAPLGLAEERAGLVEQGGGFTDLLEATAAVGQGCASAAWVASVIANSGRLTGYLPAAGQEEVWAKGPETVVAAGLIPAGTATAETGGWRVAGRWPYVSGIRFAHWVLVAARAELQGRSEVRLFAVNRNDLTVEDTWFTLGMRGTGSNTVVVDDVTVPTERSILLNSVVTGAASDSAARWHQVPLKAVNGLSLTAPLLGAAHGAVRRWSELVGYRLADAPAGVSGATDQSVYEQVLARSDGEIHMAGLALTRVADSADSGGVAASGTARNVRDCALVADLLSTAVDRLLRNAGTRAHAEHEELQRFWRDITCGAGHNALQFSPAAQLLARTVLTPETAQ